jgi:hypothetical protein
MVFGRLILNTASFCYSCAAGDYGEERKVLVQQEESAEVIGYAIFDKFLRQVRGCNKF